MKWMYGVNFHSEEDYWRQFDRKWYDGLREKYHASWMPSIYDKAVTDPKDVERRVENLSFKEWLRLYIPGRTIHAFYSAWRSGAWKHKESTWTNWVPREKE